MDEKNKNQENLEEYAPAVTAGVAAVAGATATSGVAISAAAGSATGITGYILGTGALIANIGCEAAAITGLATVAAGPILGGLIGYGVYKGVKEIVKE